jgi:hypothetical protein
MKQDRSTSFETQHRPLSRKGGFTCEPIRDGGWRLQLPGEVELAVEREAMRLEMPPWELLGQLLWRSVKNLENIPEDFLKMASLDSTSPVRAPRNHDRESRTPEPATTQLSKAEIAAHLGAIYRPDRRPFSLKSIARWCSEQGMPHYIIGNRKTFNIASVEKWADRLFARGVRL